MTYHSGFALSVKSKGNFLRESGDSWGTRTVYLPFGDEYSLYLKNKTNLRAKFQIKIDGKYAHNPETAYVVDANSSFELERFMLDGDHNKGERFKFVNVEGSGETPGEAENGFVEVFIKQEKIRAKRINPILRKTVKPNPPPVIPKKDGPTFFNDTVYTSSNSVDLDSCSGQSRSSDGVKCRNMSFTSDHTDLVATPLSQTLSMPSEPEPEGVTVGGGTSFQMFEDIPNFETENDTITLKIRLKPTKPAVEFHSNNACPGCNGTRVQTRNDGVKITCPVCNGSGTF